MTHSTIRGPLAESVATSRPGFKNSLRRIPSTLFRNNDDSHPRREKDKTVKRKGLANFLGWGRETPPPVPPLPATSEPRPVSAKPGTTTWTADDVKTTKSGSATAAAAAAAGGSRSSGDMPPPPSRQGWTRSLRTASGTSSDRTVPEHKTRPSCPPDPFERPDGGVRVVGVVDRPFAATERPQHVDAERRPFSPTITTVALDDFDEHSDDGHDRNDFDDSWVEGLSNFNVAPIQLEFDPSRSVDVPCCAPSIAPPPASRLPPLASRSNERPPSRLGSLGRALEARLDPIRETPEPPQHNKLKREKTKSRVWGLLTGKSRKSPVESHFPKSDISRSSIPSTGLARPIPVVHVTKPSNERLQPTPPKLQTNPLLHPSSPFVARQQPTQYGSRSSRALPKRKSLSGLFGISLKKSSDKLNSNSRSGTPKSSPKRKPVGKAKASPGRGQWPKRSTAKINTDATSAQAAQPNEQETVVSPMTTPLRGGDLFNDTSPDTAAFYSRFGNMGFNAEGDPTSIDVTISDTSSANTQLAKFLSAIGPSLSPLPLRKMHSTGLRSPRKRSTRSKESTSTTSSPGQPRRRDESPSPTGRRPVTDLMKGMRTMFTAPPSPSPLRKSRPVQVRADSDNEVKPSPTEAPSIPGPPPVLLISSESQSTMPLNTSMSSLQSVAPRSVTGGLPPLPPANRKVDRLAQRRQQGVPKLVVPQEDLPDQLHSNEPPRSFDFTNEVLGLDRGDGRTSFIKALHKALSNEGLSSPLKEYSPSSVKTKAPPTGKTNRPSPARFEGEAAFQKFVERTRKHSPAPTSPPRFALPPVPPPKLEPLSEHKRDESVMSFASISSLGMPLGGSSLTHDYTNYFEHNYTGIDDLPPQLPPLASMPSYTRGTSHPRSDSASSIASLAGAEISYVSGSIRCSTERAYVTRGQGSVESISTLGRPDWRSHRRFSSGASSVVSVAQISRPTVGDRMFERDERVKLESFHEGETRSWSMSSFASYNASGEAEPVDGRRPDSVFGNSNDDLGKDVDRSFYIKSRPLSGLSTSSSNADDTFDGVTKAIKEVQEEMAALGPVGKSTLAPAARARALRHRPAPLKLSESSMNTDTSALPSAHGRAWRHRPASLKLEDYSMDTPGLDTAYTSADDSSVFSWDARMSQPPLSSSMSTSFSAFFPPMPSAQSHTHSRNHSSIASAAIKVDVTIPEENSQSTLRSVHAPEPLVSERDNFNYWDGDSMVPDSVTAEWLRWQREAEDVMHQNRQTWLNSTLVEEELLHFRKPSTTLEIEKFLAESKATYKPLDQLPLGHVVNRPRMSLTRSTSRISASPYGEGVPPLESRFRNKKTSSDTCNSNRPVSALLLEFAREQAPSRQRKPSRVAPKATSKPTPRSVPSSAKKHSFHASESDTDLRQPITNSARRRNLGWGRRRPTSDENKPPTPFKLSFHDELEQTSRPVQRFRHEKQPSFIIFNPYGEENDHTDDEDEQPSPSPSRTVSPALISRPPPPRRRAVDVKVNSMGSPVNLAAEREPTPLAERKAENRLSYEPGHSPMRMRPLRSAAATTLNTTAAKRPVVKPLAKPAKPTRPVLRTSTAPQSTLEIIRTKSSPQLKIRTSPERVDNYTSFPRRSQRPRANENGAATQHRSRQPIPQHARHIFV